MALHVRFTRALDALVAEIRHDRAILAAILCGSLAHDAVWKHSDIDLVLVTIDDRKVDRASVALDADGLNVHAMLLPRAEFRRIAEGATRNSFMHSLLAKGRLLYTHDDSIAGLCDGLSDIGARDSALQTFRAASHIVPALYKAHKFFETRGDLHYTTLWILAAATPIAQTEIIRRGLLADREVIPQAIPLAPALFETIYTGLLDAPRTRERVAEALRAVDEYMAQHARRFFAPLIEHLRDVGEARSVTELDGHFKRTAGIESVLSACEYLADAGVIAKVSLPAQLTKRSGVTVQELAFVYLGDADAA